MQLEKHEIEEMCEAAANKAVDRFAQSLHLDEDSYKDFAYLRTIRTTSEKLSLSAKITIVTSFIGIMSTLIWAAITR